MPMSPPDFSAVLSAIDPSTLILAVLSVMGLIGSVLVIIAGGQFILNLIGVRQAYLEHQQALDDLISESDYRNSRF